MTLGPFDRRRSERFAELVDEPNRRRHRQPTGVDAELTEMAALARRLAKLPIAAQPHPEFRAALRAMLMATIERDGIGATAAEKAALDSMRAALAGKTQVIRQVSATGGHGRARVAVLTGVAAGALALSGVSVASTDSLPGEPLYQVKRSSERAQLALAGSELGRGQLYLEFARTRLTEARVVDAARLAHVLMDMNAHLRQGARLLATAAVQHNDVGPLDTIVRFVESQRALLLDVDARTPTARQALDESRALLDRVEARALGLKAALTRGCTITAGDDLGPRPDDC